jgi:hypothetical protein
LMRSRSAISTRSPAAVPEMVGTIGVPARPRRVRSRCRRLRPGEQPTESCWLRASAGHCAGHAKWPGGAHTLLRISSPSPCTLSLAGEGATLTHGDLVLLLGG